MVCVHRQREAFICLLIYGDLISLMQELLYLYGFVIDNNPDDYLMVIY